jgi:hypothetical protein
MSIYLNDADKRRFNPVEFVERVTGQQIYALTQTQKDALNPIELFNEIYKLKQDAMYMSVEMQKMRLQVQVLKEKLEAYEHEVRM